MAGDAAARRLAALRAGSASQVTGWWARRNLRARLTVAATGGLALALLAAAMLLHGAVRTSLVHGLDAAARQGARQVAALADRHRLPDPVPVAAGTLTIQVLGTDGRIVAASPGADRLVPLLPAGQAAADARTGHAVLMDGRPYGLPGLVWVVAVPTHDHRTVLAAVTYDQVSGGLHTITAALLLGTPLLLLLLAGVCWLVAGSALRPIAELRRGAEEVTRTGRPRALPLPAARDEVHSLAVTLNDMLRRLGAAQERQRGLISDTAHELRSPIASIRAQLEVALDHPDGQDWPRTAADVLSDTLRLARLTEDLLILARLEEREGARPLPHPVPLAGLAAEEVRRQAGARVPVRLASAPPCTVSGDPDGLRRVLVNLLDNAVRYARSRVEVSVTQQGGEARITVTDDGPGIPAADTERAFGRFTRLDPARDRADDGHSGAGLGLAIVRATVQAHGGWVWLEDAEPGLRAVVLLPTAAGQAPDPVPARPAGQGGNRRAGGRVTRPPRAAGR